MAATLHARILNGQNSEPSINGLNGEVKQEDLGDERRSSCMLYSSGQLEHSPPLVIKVEPGQSNKRSSPSPLLHSPLKKAHLDPVRPPSPELQSDG